MVTLTKKSEKEMDVCWSFIEVENEDLKKVVELAEKCQYSKNMVDGHAKSWPL